mmetsp:Transcript_20074/g.59989  ORF Transcript_20074/g.59989 Transcript_20074/m.59989 type:complete len:443 (-) Transcript_20074:101-1429(-)
MKHWHASHACRPSRDVRRGPGAFSARLTSLARPRYRTTLHFCRVKIGLLADGARPEPLGELKDVLPLELLLGRLGRGDARARRVRGARVVDLRELRRIELGAPHRRVDLGAHLLPARPLERVRLLRKDECAVVRPLLRVAAVRDDAVAVALADEVPVLVEGEAEHLALHHQVGAARAARPRHELLLEVVLPRAGAARLRDAKEDVVVERAVGGGGKGVGLARVVVVLWVVAEHLEPLALEVGGLERADDGRRVGVEGLRVLLDAGGDALLLLECAREPGVELLRPKPRKALRRAELLAAAVAEAGDALEAGGVGEARLGRLLALVEEARGVRLHLAALLRKLLKPGGRGELRRGPGGDVGGERRGRRRQQQRRGGDGERRGSVRKPRRGSPPAAAVTNAAADAAAAAAAARRRTMVCGRGCALQRDCTSREREAEEQDAMPW